MHSKRTNAMWFLAGHFLAFFSFGMLEYGRFMGCWAGKKHWRQVRALQRHCYAVPY
jgi:hypothetical protein